MVDKGAERVIIATLSANFPDHAFKAEESGAAGTSRYTWIIDPLDGTTNFLHGIPHYCVSIALQIDNTVIAVGVVFDPTSGRLFTAMRGHGAFLDGERIHVSDRPGLTEAVLGTGFRSRTGTTSTTTSARCARSCSAAPASAGRAPLRSTSRMLPPAGSTAIGRRA